MGCFSWLCLCPQVSRQAIIPWGCQVRFCTPRCRSGSSQSFTKVMKPQASLSTARACLTPSLWVRAKCHKHVLILEKTHFLLQFLNHHFFHCFKFDFISVKISMTENWKSKNVSVVCFQTRMAQCWCSGAVCTGRYRLKAGWAARCPSVSAGLASRRPSRRLPFLHWTPSGIFSKVLLHRARSVTSF